MSTTDVSKSAVENSEAGRRPLRLAIVNDYELVVAGVSSMLQAFPEWVEVVELDLNSEPTHQVDIAVYDTFGASVAAADLRALVKAGKVARTVVYSFSDDEEAVRDSLATGVDGFISKAVSPTRLIEALQRIAAGERVVERSQEMVTLPDLAWPGQEDGLTEREAEVIALIAQGLSNEEIARTCYLSINTVKTYIRSAYRKAGVSTRAQAVAWALRHGFRPERKTTH